MINFGNAKIGTLVLNGVKIKGDLKNKDITLGEHGKISINEIEYTPVDGVINIDDLEGLASDEGN